MTQCISVKPKKVAFWFFNDIIRLHRDLSCLWFNMLPEADKKFYETYLEDVESVKNLEDLANIVVEKVKHIACVDHLLYINETRYKDYVKLQEIRTGDDLLQVFAFLTLPLMKYYERPKQRTEGLPVKSLPIETPFRFRVGTIVTRHIGEFETLYHSLALSWLKEKLEGNEVSFVEHIENCINKIHKGYSLFVLKGWDRDENYNDAPCFIVSSGKHFANRLPMISLLYGSRYPINDDQVIRRFIRLAHELYNRCA